MSEDFSKRQLLHMIVPVSQTSKNKASKAEKDKLEVKRSFSHILSKVKKEIKKALPPGDLFFLLGGCYCYWGVQVRLRPHGG